ncbi:MAG: NVEALA domain-containing protein [Parabacteroides sp.]|nr:NVEALA domain-containing protein [Parabacteroides sp.]
MQKVFLILLVGVLGVFIASQAMETLIVADDVLLVNVEALANGEDEEPIVCRGSGNYSCPLDGDKYGFVYKGYSLR